MSDEDDDFDVHEFVAEANKWDDLYLNSTIHAVKLYHRQSQVREIILKFLSHKNRAAFKLTNPFSKRIWLRELLIALYGNDQWWKKSRAKCQKDDEDRLPLMAGLKSGGVVCALVTFTDESWACPDTAIEFDLKRAKQKVRNALNGLSYVAAFEAAYYVNEEWEKNGKRGKLVSFHCHAVVWATNWSQLARRRFRIKPRFRPILGNKTGVRFDVLKKADDVCKAIRYQAKMPARGYRTIAHASGKKTQTSAKLSYLARYRLFTALAQYDLLDFWLGGGEGKCIFHSARKSLAEHRQRQREQGLGVGHPGSRIPRPSADGSRVGAF
jgi:hypothetical protein